MKKMATEEYSVQLVRSELTGHIVRESWRMAGELHRIGAAAYREFDEQTGQLIMERWLRHGLNHRDGGEASMTEWNHLTGTVSYEQYCVNGQLHRDQDRPAQIWYDDKQPEPTKEIYFYADKEHRAAGPARIERDPVSGLVTLEQWKRNGHLHRDKDEPSVTRWDASTGHVILEEYWFDGRLHRISGPARIMYDQQSGKLMSSEYFRLGRSDKSMPHKHFDI